jgi:hypothetical protein
LKEFTRVQFDPVRCRQELAAFRALLDGKRELEEKADLKPFFEANQHFSALLGSYGWDNAHYDLLAFQYQLFGDFSCDLVVGDSNRKAYGLVELEDATAGCLFRQQGRKATPEWATRFEHGFSRILDWFWKLDEVAHTEEFVERFGDRRAPFFGLLVAGRDEHLAHPRERRRWQWRARKVLVNSLPIRFVTYDQLCQDLSIKLGGLHAAARQAEADRRGEPPA